MAVSSTFKRGCPHVPKKKGWSTFLRPGWVLGVLAIIAFSYVSFAFFAPWQFNKDEAIVKRNEQIKLAFEIDPAPAEEIFDAQGSIDPGEEWAQVILKGRYLAEGEVLLRNRPVDSSPAFQSLVPFQLHSGSTILVNRGFEPPVAGGVPPLDAPPTGEQIIIGHARLTEQRPESIPIDHQGYRQVYGLNTEQVAQVTGLDLAEDYVQLAEGQPGETNAILVPMLERGSHLSYALQWFAFGIMAPLGLGYFIWAELKERGRVRREEAALAAKAQSPSIPGPHNGALEAGTEGSADTADEEEATVSAVSRARMLRQRYGGNPTNYSKRFVRRDSEEF